MRQRCNYPENPHFNRLGRQGREAWGEQSGEAQGEYDGEAGGSASASGEAWGELSGEATGGYDGVAGSDNNARSTGPCPRLSFLVWGKSWRAGGT